MSVRSPRENELVGMRPGIGSDSPFASDAGAVAVNAAAEPATRRPTSVARLNRARARSKGFVEKYGIDELRNQVEEELKGEWVAERDFSVQSRLFLVDEQAAAPQPPASYGTPNGDLSEFDEFRVTVSASVRPS